MNPFEKPKIDLIASLQGLEDKILSCEEIAVIGALSCFEEKSALQLWEGYQNKLESGELNEESFNKIKERVFKETAGRGHGSVSDQNMFSFCMEDVPRLFTLQICQPEYLAHLQQSLRRATADRGFYIPKSIQEKPSLCKETIDILDQTFKLYNEMSENGVPAEDARFVLPLFTKTNILTTGNARELMHFYDMSTREHTPSTIKEIAGEMMNKLRENSPRLFKDRETNKEVLAWRPSAQMFAPENRTINDLISKYACDSENVVLINHSGIDMDKNILEDAIKNRNEEELANLKHVHYTFLVKLSLACWHQAMRQRTWNQSVESIYNATGRWECVIPPSIAKNPTFSSKYQNLNDNLLGLYYRLINNKIPEQEAIGVLPHALTIYDLVHVDGWNAIHAIGKRTCTEAQWEIRGIAKKMADLIKEVDPVLGKYAEPQGITYGRCPEKKPCGYCEKKLKK